MQDVDHPNLPSDGICDVCTSGGVEKYGIFWWFQSFKICLAALLRSGVPPFNNFPALSATIVKNSSVDPNAGRLYIRCSASASVRATISSTTAIGSSTSYTLTTLRSSTLPLRALFRSAASPSSSNTTPGESTMRMPRSSCTDWSSLVWPGCDATAHAFERLSVLMSEDLPTFG